MKFTINADILTKKLFKTLEKKKTRASYKL